MTQLLRLKPFIYVFGNGIAVRFHKHEMPISSDVSGLEREMFDIDPGLSEELDGAPVIASMVRGLARDDQDREANQVRPLPGWLRLEHAVRQIR